MENNNKRSSIFHSYCLNPQIKFDTHQEGEKIHLLIRNHPITQVGWILSAILYFIILFIVNIYFYQIFNLGQLLMLNIFLIIFIFSYIWFGILNWYFNVGIVTNKRVIDIDYYAILYKEITTAQLGKIEDITVKSGGYFQSFFDYGSIFIQTAGLEANIEFANIPHPSEVAQIISQLLGRKHGR